MRKILFPVIALAILVSGCKSDKKEGAEAQVKQVHELVINNPTHTVDVEKSTIAWEGFKPTGAHNGTLKLSEGVVMIDKNGLQKGKFVMDMTSLENLDLPAGDDMHGKLVGHLKSGDFFDVENHPTANFSFSEVADGKMKGNLTIKGITKPVEIPYTLSENMLKAEPFKIDRTEYDIKYKSKKFFDNLKDKFINDEFEVSFKVALEKK